MEQSMCMVLLVFSGWTLTSFLCHFFAKSFLNGSTTVFNNFHLNYNVLILTGMQIIFCITLTQFLDNSETASKANKYIILLLHGLATLATNWSMSVTYAASTFAIKLMEPLTGAIAQRLFLGTKLPSLQYISLPVVVLGAIVFVAEDYDKFFNLSKGSIIAFLSNISLALRNVVIKKEHISNSEIAFSKRWTWCCLFGTCCTGLSSVYFLENDGKVPGETTYLFCLVVMSSLFHVLYSCISTGIVLKYFSVVGHAVSNLLKRLFVLGLLYITGSRNASWWNICGLVFCMTGISLYAWSKTITTQTSGNKNNYIDDNLSPKMRRAEIKILVSLAAVVVFVMLLNKYGSDSSYVKPEPLFAADANIAANYYTKSDDTQNMQRSFLKKFDKFDFVEEFYKVDLTKHPEQANTLSPLLASRRSVITEAQRIHTNILGTLLSSYKYAMLFDFSPSENKGDSAIAVGEMILLRRLNIDLIFHCPVGSCNIEVVEEAQQISKNYTDKELVILFHGGGNVIGYPSVDVSRSNVIKRFMGFKIIMFPQSIYYTDNPKHIKFCKKTYASHDRLIFLWRDRVSYDLGKQLFPKVHSLLSPDMAYEIGLVPRFMAPTHDILWIKRTDDESPGYKAPASVKGYRIHVADWLQWGTPRGTKPMDNIFLMTTNGMMFLQRGRVVITDRLHGHILCTLLDIPHVYIDNKERKISNYHNTWTAGINNIVLANSSTDALTQAKKLLIKLDMEIPKIQGFF